MMNKAWYEVAVSSPTAGSGTLESFDSLQSAKVYAEWLCVHDREILADRVDQSIGIRPMDIELVFIDRWVQTEEEYTEPDETFKELKYVPIYMRGDE
jgi:hypothetical protein